MPLWSWRNGRLGEVAAPFHLEATVRVLQRRPGNLVDTWEHGRYRRVLETPQGLAWVEVENRGTIDAPDLCYRLRGANRVSRATRAGLVQTLRRVLGLHLDPQPLLRLAHADRRLRPAARALRGLRPPRFTGLFEAFASVVPFQQLSLDAGVAIVGRLVERFGTRLEHDGASLRAFPTAQAIAEARLERLRQCGLSTRKAQVLRALGRLEVFPPGDVGAARGLRTLMQLGAGAPLERIIERFGDYRGYLYFYALGASLLSKGLIHAAPIDSNNRAREAPRSLVGAFATQRSEKADRG